jgi:murein DD-endopeptidase MepM/ murein hydrolase activator NlpD
MPGATWYPKADTKAQRRDGFGGSKNLTGITMTSVSKVVLHSTETAGWPGYPDFAPNLTYDPWKHEWHQHMAINKSATTLLDPSSTAVRENRDNVVQVEIVGYCDPARRSSGKDIEKIDELAVRELGAFIAWMNQEWQVPFASVPAAKWISYPGSYGNTKKQRFSGTEYDSFKGVLGHQHVSGNDHGDPGALPIERIMAAAKEIAAGAKPPAPPVPETPLVPEPKPVTPPKPLPEPTTVPVVPGGKVYTPYGTPGSWAAGYHTGDDWHTGSGSADTGKRVNAPVSGKILHAGKGGWAPEYGIHVIIEDVTGDRTAVCHLLSESVSVGDYVEYGEQVGRQDTTGNATGPHVHVERRHAPFGYWQHEKPHYGDVAPYPGVNAFKLGQTHAAVTLLDRRLIAHGCASHHDGNGYNPGPTFTKHTLENVQDFQKAQGWSGSDADGYPGPSTWKLLLARVK